VEALLAYLHYLAIMLIAAALTAELVLCRPGLGAGQARLLACMDVLFFAAALGALATGLIRLFWYAKGLAFYLPNPAFHAKMAFYVVIALISIRPTLRFLRWKRTLQQGGPAPADAEVLAVRRLIHLELALLALMPLLAVLMARGLGR
jgi:putative membrane protein